MHVSARLSHPQAVYKYIKRESLIFLCSMLLVRTPGGSIFRIFNSLPCNIKTLKNEKAQFKAALRRYLNAHCFYSVDEFFMSTVNL
jgi:hypothetical protein